MTFGEEAFNKCSKIMTACELSHAEFQIVIKTFRENNWFTDAELQREVVGEPQADYLKPYLPAITLDVAERALERLLNDGILRRRTGREVGALVDGYSLTTKGKRLGKKLERMWRNE